MKKSKKLLALLPVAALVFAACGSDDASEPTRSTVSLSTGSTAFVVKPPVTTLPGAQGVFEDGTTSAIQEYEIQSGDYPLGVAQQFGVDVDDLVNFNGWASASEFPFPGTVIRIPPGAIFAGSSGETEEAVIVVDADTGEPIGEEIPEAGDNCSEGEHTVVAGDFPLVLVRKYDVTLEALAAANAANPAYGQFIVGQTIIIPAKDDC